MVARGVRGAICVAQNTPEAIIAQSKKLLNAMVDQNNIVLADIACVWLTTTTDLNAEFPAVAARQLGWTDVPLLCAHEMQVPHALASVVRAMMLYNTTKTQTDIQHVYLDGAEVLRPDVK